MNDKNYPYLPFGRVTAHYGYSYEKVEGIGWTHVIYFTKTENNPIRRVAQYKNRDNAIGMCKHFEREYQKLIPQQCPICEYPFLNCQCTFGGSAHPDRSKRREVVKDHLYLLNEEQVKHIIYLESRWQTSYGDDEKNEIVTELKNDYSDRGGEL